MTTITNEAAESDAEPSPPSPVELHGFLSYAWENPQDQRAIDRLAQEMRMRGIRTFRDRDAFGHGDRIEDEIDRALSTAHVYVPYLTPEALRSSPVKRLEFGPAQQRHADGELSVVPVARRLGATREEVAARVWQETGHSLKADWTGAYDGDDELTVAQTSEVAGAALRCAVRRAGIDAPITITVATHGDCPAGPGILVDGTELLGGPTRRAGRPEDWQRFLAALNDLHRQLAQNAASKRGHIETPCHLAAAVAAGWTFRQSRGWLLTGVSRGHVAPAATVGCPELKTTHVNGPALDDGTLIVQIGLIRDIERDVTNAVKRGPQPRRRIRIGHDLGDDIPAARLADAARATANEIKRHADQSGCARIELYMAAPAAYALHLGSYLASLPPIGLHEPASTDYVHVLDLQD